MEKERKRVANHIGLALFSFTFIKNSRQANQFRFDPSQSVEAINWRIYCTKNDTITKKGDKINNKRKSIDYHWLVNGIDQWNAS